MKRHLLPLAALLACAVLAAAIVAVAVSSASGTPSGSVLAAPRPGGPTPPKVTNARACSVTGSHGPSAVTVDGACSGSLKDTFACVKGGGVLALSARLGLDSETTFYLTILIPDFRGPGAYAEAEAFAQIAGSPESLRWSDREVLTRVDPSGTVELGRAVLRAEPGTPASGTITAFGHVACSR